MMLEEPQMTADDLSKIKCPTYIVAGEYDIMDLSDTVFIHESIPNSKMAVVKGADHSTYIMHHGDQAYALIDPYIRTL